MEHRLVGTFLLVLSLVLVLPFGVVPVERGALVGGAWHVVGS